MKQHCGSVEAFEYDGIKVDWTSKERKALNDIRKRNAKEPPNNGNYANGRKTSGTLPYMAIGKDIFDIRVKWKHDLLEGMRDV